jgi:hypothetical protein
MKTINQMYYLAENTRFYDTIILTKNSVLNNIVQDRYQIIDQNKELNL